MSDVDHYYPSKAEEISDEAVSDRGGNFGRFARTDLMDPFMDGLFQEELSGIPLDSWQRFLRMFGEQTPPERIDQQLERMAAEAARGRRALSAETTTALRERLREVVDLLDRL